MNVLDEYVLSSPSQQNIIDIFQGEWSSKLPDGFNLNTQPGQADLFQDARVLWAEDIFGGFNDWNILELGPLEGGHSYMFQEKGAAKVTAIEANKRAFLKCLCIKEVLNLNKVNFWLGDFISFLKQGKSTYDMVFASGILYHLESPIELLHLASKVTERLFIWTHYYDQEIIAKNKALAHKFEPTISGKYGDFAYSYSIQSYKKALDWQGFCGGPKQISKWLTRDSLLEALREFGFSNIDINFEHADHPNGPALALCAQK